MSGRPQNEVELFGVDYDRCRECGERHGCDCDDYEDFIDASFDQPYGFDDDDCEEEHLCETCDGEGMVDLGTCPDCGGDGTDLAYQ